MSSKGVQIEIAKRARLPPPRQEAPPEERDRGKAQHPGRASQVPTPVSSFITQSPSCDRPPITAEPRTQSRRPVGLCLNLPDLVPCLIFFALWIPVHLDPLLRAVRAPDGTAVPHSRFSNASQAMEQPFPRFLHSLLLYIMSWLDTG